MLNTWEQTMVSALRSKTYNLEPRVMFLGLLAKKNPSFDTIYSCVIVFTFFFYIVTLCDTFVDNWVSSFQSLCVLFLSGSFIVSMGTTLYTTESLHCTAPCCRSSFQMCCISKTWRLKAPWLQSFGENLLSKFVDLFIYFYLLMAGSWFLITKWSGFHM